MIYQRAPSEADRLIADRLGGLMDGHHTGATTDSDEDDDGTAGSMVPVA